MTCIGNLCGCEIDEFSTGIANMDCVKIKIGMSCSRDVECSNADHRKVSRCINGRCSCPSGYLTVEYGKDHRGSPERTCVPTTRKSYFISKLINVQFYSNF